MSARQAAFFPLLLVLGASSPLADVLTPVSQDRAVSGSASASDDLDFDNDSDSAQATDFGVFSEGASAFALVFNGLGSGGGSQTSRILPSSIEAVGSSFANGEGYSFDGFGSGSGSSSFNVTFDVLLPCTYTLTGYVEAYDSGGASMSLLQDSTFIFSAGAGNEQVLISESGTLAPGRYTLNANTSGSAFGGSGFFGYASGAYDITLDLASLSATPSIASLTPAVGSFGGGNTVLVNGACFAPGSAVSIDGTPAVTTFVNSTTLMVEVPAHPLSASPFSSLAPTRVRLSVDVVVANGGNTDTLAAGYSYLRVLLPQPLGGL